MLQHDRYCLVRVAVAYSNLKCIRSSVCRQVRELCKLTTGENFLSTLCLNAWSRSKLYNIHAHGNKFDEYLGLVLHSPKNQHSLQGK